MAQNKSFEEQKQIILNVFNNPYENWDFALTILFVCDKNGYQENLCLFVDKYSLYDKKNAICLRGRNGHETFTLDLVRLFNKSTINTYDDILNATWKSKDDFVSSGAIEVILNGCEGWTIKKIFRDMPFDYDSSGELIIWHN